MEEEGNGVSAALRFEHVSKTFVRANGDRETVLDDFSLDIAPGELVAVVGSSGIGKSTILHLAAGLEQPDAGRVAFTGGGRPRLGMVFQQPRLFDWLTAADNIAVAVNAAGGNIAKARDMLAAVGLARQANAYPLALSGGQRQRVALARAFAIEPDAVLLDEPFSALDELTARKLRLLLQELWLDYAPSGILVTHNTLEAAFLADRIVVLTGKPARIKLIIAVGDARPRNTENSFFFDLHREILATLERSAG
jgi:NitT/TauT family transport system ATP-binding protein